MRFYRARTRRGLTQAGAAQALGVSLPTVARWETAVSEPRGLVRRHVDAWIRKAMEGK